MKKFWIVLLSLLLSFACVIGFAACDETPPDDETGGIVQPDDPSGPDDPGKPHEHDFGEWTVTIPATCTEEGEEQRTCSCGETETRPIAAKGHTEAIDAAVAPTCTETGLTEGKHCSVCNEVLVEQEVLQTIPHNYVDGVCTRCGGTIAATDDSYFIFTELEDGTYSVAWDRNTDLPAEVVIPREYNGKSVTQVERFAFYDCNGLTDITIPESVTSIGDYVFNSCLKLKSITVSEENPVYHSDGNCLIETESKTLIAGCKNSVIPDDGSVTSIGYSAFGGCESLTSIDIPDSVTSIGTAAFHHCYWLTSITIPDSVTSIGEEAFRGCDGVCEVENGVTYVDRWGVDCDEGVTNVSLRSDTIGIADKLFEHCSGLASIAIPDSVTSIGDRAFAYCDGLTNVTIGGSVISIGENAFYSCDGLTSVTIPDSVISIGEKAFYSCEGLTSVTIGDGVTSIGRFAFAYCDSLASVTIGDGVTSLGGYAFYDCNSLKSIVIPDSVTSIGDWAFAHCGLTSINIPGSVTFIGSSAFSCCSFARITVSAENPVYHSDGNCLIETESKTLIVGCKNSVIPDDGSVTSIGQTAFANCYSLTSIIIPNSVISIGDNAFDCCTSLTSITIPDSVTSIGDWAFDSCSGLASITIGGGVTSIGSSAFYRCDSLTSISVTTGNPVYHSAGNCLIETESKTLIVGCKNSIIPDDGSVTSIGDWAFVGYCSLTSITIPNDVTSIGKGAFQDCIGLTSITIPDSVTYIGDSAFSSCKSLTSVVIGNGVTSIGDSAFSSCSRLTSVTIPDSVTSIGSHAFYSCDNLARATFVNPNGWSVDGETISAEDLSDPVTAAKYLSDTYYRDAWTRA